MGAACALTYLRSPVRTSRTGHFRRSASYFRRRPNGGSLSVSPRQLATATTVALLLVAEAAVTLSTTGQAFAVSAQKARTPSAAKPRPASTGPLSAPDAASAFATARLRKRKVSISWPYIMLVYYGYW